jgi:integrase
MTEPQRRRRRKVFTHKMAEALPRRRRRYFHPDPEMPGHGVRVLPDGPSSFYVIARDAFRKQRWVKIGNTAELTIEDSREQARAVLKRLKAGLTPFELPPVRADTVADVVATWVKRHVETKGLLTGHELERVLRRHVLPVWRDRAFADIKRSDIARLLDSVEDVSGAWVADSVLAALRSVASWYASRHDSYVPPFVKNMRRVPAQARKRSRTLTDDELRRVWKAAEASDDVYGAFVRVALLTGQRRAKVATMKWSDIAEGGTWRIPTASPREKGNAGVLKLPPLAMAIIKARPHVHGSPYVFTGSHNGAIDGFSTRHFTLKARAGVEAFSIHDLRRCCRSLMARANVLPHVAERVLGHVVGGVEGVYDQHGYDVEKADALKRLARLIERIVDGEGGKNVVPMRAPAVQP